jgi:transcriptional regulator with XRE-family HTH domain
MEREGGKIRRAPRRRRWTQAQLGRKVGLSQPTLSQIERGRGGSHSVHAWQRLAIALHLPLEVQLGRDALEEPADVGHLAVQELALRIGRAAGYLRTFELQTRPADPSRSTDVGLRSDSERRLIRLECVNTFGDIGAAVRSSDRKDAEAEAYAVAIGHGLRYTVHTCWIIRATRRNRELIARYPEVFASRFPGSSAAWLQALTAGSAPPAQSGLVWCDVKATRLYAWRRRPAAGAGQGSSCARP